MRPIHQVYCTHCTYGTSLFHQASAETANKPFEYSARAASLPGEALRSYYRAIEPFLRFYLPSDTPTEEKLACTANKAPRALFAAPRPEGLQLVGQVSFRVTDTAGRPGSYFAHVLFQDGAGQHWDPCQLLRLWGAQRWVDQDRPDLPTQLPTLEQPGDLLRGEPTALSDDVLHSFLTASAGGPFHDPGELIPPAWRERAPEDRVAVLQEVLAAVLETAPQARSRVLVVVEPTLAALLFYGVFRLLPRGTFGDLLSWCTYESMPARPAMRLSATTFHVPTRTDLPAEAYGADRGYAVNTFLNRRTQRRLAGSYAPYLIDRLLEKGWEAVDATLESLRASGVTEAADLESRVVLQRQVSLVLDSNLQSLPEPLPTSPAPLLYLKQAVAREVDERRRAHRLRDCIGTPAHFRALELLAAEPTVSQAATVVQPLLDLLPDKWLPRFLAIPGLTIAARVEVLARYVRKNGTLPPGCEPLLETPDPKKPSKTSQAEAILTALVAELEHEKVVQLLFNGSVRPDQWSCFVTPLYAALNTDPRKRIFVVRLLKELIERSPTPRLCEFLRAPEHQRQVQTLVAGEATVQARLQKILVELPRAEDASYDVTLQILHSLRPALGQEALTLDAWQVCSQHLEAVHGVLKNGAAGKAAGPEAAAALDNACKKLAYAWCQAVPDKRYRDSNGRLKLICLQRWVTQRLGRQDVLPPTIWKKFADAFRGVGKWPTAAGGTDGSFLARFLPQSVRPWLRGKEVYVAAAGVAIVLVVVMFAVVLSRPRPQTSPDEPPTPQTDGNGGPAKLVKGTKEGDKPNDKEQKTDPKKEEKGPQDQNLHAGNAPKGGTGTLDPNKDRLPDPNKEALDKWKATKSKLDLLAHQEIPKLWEKLDEARIQEKNARDICVKQVAGSLTVLAIPSRKGLPTPEFILVNTFGMAPKDLSFRLMAASANEEARNRIDFGTKQLPIRISRSEEKLLLEIRYGDEQESLEERTISVPVTLPTKADIREYHVRARLSRTLLAPLVMNAFVMGAVRPHNPPLTEIGLLQMLDSPKLRDCPRPTELEELLNVWRIALRARREAWNELTKKAADYNNDTKKLRSELEAAAKDIRKEAQNKLWAKTKEPNTLVPRLKGTRKDTAASPRFVLNPQTVLGASPVPSWFQVALDVTCYKKNENGSETPVHLFYPKDQPAPPLNVLAEESIKGRELPGDCSRSKVTVRLRLQVDPTGEEPPEERQSAPIDIINDDVDGKFCEKWEYEPVLSDPELSNLVAAAGQIQQMQSELTKDLEKIRKEKHPSPSGAQP